MHHDSSLPSDSSSTLDIHEHEDNLQSRFISEFSGIDLNSASQWALQSALNNKTLAQCKESASIRDRACLNTLGTSSVGHGYW